MGSTTCQLATRDEVRVTPAFQAGVSPYDCLWGKGPGRDGLSGQGQPCVSEQHTQAGISHRASLRSAQAWGWTEDAPTCFPGWHIASGISICSLSLVQVGCFLKTPRFPIWVVCSESHFSVLFSQQLELLRDWRAERLFDLYYYDGLANQQEQIRLTIGAPPPHPSCATWSESTHHVPLLAPGVRVGTRYQVPTLLCHSTSLCPMTACLPASCTDYIPLAAVQGVSVDTSKRLMTEGPGD